MEPYLHCRAGTKSFGMKIEFWHKHTRNRRTAHRLHFLKRMESFAVASPEGKEPREVRVFRAENKRGLVN